MFNSDSLHWLGAFKCIILITYERVGWWCKMVLHGSWKSPWIWTPWRWCTPPSATCCTSGPSRSRSANTEYRIRMFCKFVSASFADLGVLALLLVLCPALGHVVHHLVRLIPGPALGNILGAADLGARQITILFREIFISLLLCFSFLMVVKMHLMLT